MTVLSETERQEIARKDWDDAGDETCSPTEIDHLEEIALDGSTGMSLGILRTLINTVRAERARKGTS